MGDLIISRWTSFLDKLEKMFDRGHEVMYILCKLSLIKWAVLNLGISWQDRSHGY